MAFITHVGTAVPPFKLEQGRIAKFMEGMTGDDAARKRKMHAAFRMSKIATRYSVLQDFGKEDEFTFYSNREGPAPFPSTVQRMQAYRVHAPSLSLNAINNCATPSILSKITHLITVSCTGMYAPGLDVDLVNRLGLPTTTERICINFMGCYAAISALRMADAICKANDVAKVLIVCTELCTLHFQKDFSEDNILASALFGDGSAAMVVESSPSTRISFSIESFHTQLLLSNESDMAWGIGNFGFEMKLSSYVPEIIQKGIRLIFEELKRKDYDVSQIRHFAIHPGGRKILDVMKDELSHLGQDLGESYQVLSEYGNMSSPTIVFVLNEIFKKISSKNTSEFIYGIAFGPGLTIETVLLKSHFHAKMVVL